MKRFLQIIIAAFFLLGNVLAQPGSNDTTFNVLDDCSFNGSGFNGIVYASLTQLDGKIVIGGSFTIFNGVSRNRIARLNTDGSLDLSFNPGSGFNNDVRTIALQTDGKIIVGGDFTLFNGTTYNRIIRLNTNGTNDVSFNSGTGFNNSVRSISLQTDGKIVVGGFFTTWNGTTTRNRIARLNGTGNLDGTFNPGTGFNTSVNTTSIQSDGKIIAGGNFTSFNGTTTNKIARINTNGTLDATFNVGTGFDFTVWTTTINSSGQIYVGGDFGTINGVVRNKLAVLNTNGSVTNISNIINGTIYSIQVEGGDLIIAGNFVSVGGTTRNRIASLGNNGILNPNRYNGTFNNTIYTTTFQSLQSGYDKLVVAGNFTTFNGVCRTRIARLENLCNINAPSGSGIQNFCNGSTISNLVANGTAIQWYSSASGGTVLNTLTPLTNGTTYYATQTVSGCESPLRLAVTVNLTNVSAPTGATTQTLCTGATVANLVATGNNIQWYSTATGVTPLAATTVLSNGTTYYATQTVSGCQSTSRLAVTVSIVNPAAPSGTATQTFCYGATVANLIANGSNIQWYTVPNGGTSLLTTAALISGTTYYATQTVSGCESTTRLAVTVSVANSPVSPPTGSSNQSFCNSAIIGNLVANGTNIIWYQSPVGGAPLTASTILSNGTTYYASQTVSGCTSTTRLAVTVTINSTPIAPTGSTSQSFCYGATVADLVANGSNIQWYATLSGGTPLSSITLLVNGTTYYATQTVSGCQSNLRLTVNVNVLTSSVSAPNGSATQTFCIGSSVSNLIANGSNIQWYPTSNGGAALSSTTPLTNGTTYYATQTISGCESSARLSVTVSLNTTSAPTGQANQSFCNSATVSNLTANGTSIQWFSSPTAGTVLTPTTTLTNGFTYYASQTVSGCSSVNRLAVTVTINNTPSSAVSINGNILIANQAGATYQWLDCNNNLSPIQGQTSQSFIPQTSGSYAVSISSGACSVTTACTNLTIVGVNTPQQLTYNIYPNPTSSLINIEKTGSLSIAEISIYDVLGRKISSIMPGNNSLIQMEMPQIPGTYYISIEDENGKRALFKVLKI